MLASIPAPKQHYVVHQDDDQAVAPARPAAPKKAIPAYPNRKGFIPMDPEDFNDGGAYPECHVLQYPLNVGKPGQRSTAIVAVDVDEKGEVRYDAITRRVNKNQIVQTTINAIKEKAGDTDKLSLPTHEEEENVTEKTRKALEAILESKITSAKPTSVAKHNDEASFIRYTPNPNAPGSNPAVQQRVIKMVEAQVDPLEPPKHEFKKVARVNTEAPVPVLHSPPRKLTVADQQAWKIPPPISNWKNAKGFIIPLDKRLAADGRGLQEVTINNNAATLSEALYVAERKNAEELRIRRAINQQNAKKEKEDREAELKKLAINAREERAKLLEQQQRADLESLEEKGREREYDRDNRNYNKEQLDESYDNDGRGRRNSHSRSSSRGRGRSRSDSRDRRRSRSHSNDRRGRSNSRDSRDDRDDDRDNRDRRGRSRSDSRDRRRHRSRSDSREGRRGGRDSNANKNKNPEYVDKEKQEEYLREQMRIEKRKELEREMKMEKVKGARKSKAGRDGERDISEKIALGMHKGSAKLAGESMFDSRLFNQSAGLDSGFGADDEYNTYSKPLFDRGGETSIYRPKKNDSEMYGDADAEIQKLKETSKFRPDKGFRGADSAQASSRDGPVQFEKQRKREESDDPFGIDDLVPSKKSRRNDSDSESDK